MTAAELIELRKALGLTQAEMAQGIDLSLRAYQTIEAGQGELKTRHDIMVERLALSVAVRRGNPMLAPASVRRDALALARLINEG